MARRVVLTIAVYTAIGVAAATVLAWAIALTAGPAHQWSRGVQFPAPSGEVHCTGRGYDVYGHIGGLTTDPGQLSPRLAPPGSFTYEGGASWTSYSNTESSGTGTRTITSSGFRFMPGGRTLSIPYVPRELPADVAVAAVGVYGWPLRCLAADAAYPTKGEPRLKFAVRVADRKAGPVFAWVLPLRPLWAGLAADVAVFGGGAWVLIGLPPLIVRNLPKKRRLREGRCPDCGYDLLHDFAGGCPECGWNRKPAAAE